MNEIKNVTAREACHLVAGLLGADGETLFAHYNGFDWSMQPDDPKGWSMPAEEAALLYAVARMTKPRTIIELGTHVGYSASCLLKAMNENGCGRLVTVDNNPQLKADSELKRSYRVFPITADGVAFSRKLLFPLDMIFEDGNHSVEVTSGFLRNCLPKLRSGGVVFVHDVAHPECGWKVTEGMRLSLGESFERIAIRDSKKGLGFWVKP